MVERVSTGVNGLDKLIGGGIPKGSVVLVSGAPGTGKTILAMQFLENGLKKGEKCVYVTIEEPPEKIMRQADQFSFFMKAPEMISAKDIRYDLSLGKKPEGMEAKIKLVLEKLAKLKPARVVVDSVSSLTLEDGVNARGLSRMLIEGLNSLNATCLITGESINGNYPDEVTPFLTDGVIILSLDALGSQITRSLIIQKMRMTDYEVGVSNLEIVVGKGIKVEPTR